eukprot:m.9750 g.9750  ORF g.9750 m.9750 type:complete len:392 (+) comp21603_c0_seq1:31-1206(+)
MEVVFVTLLAFLYGGVGSVDPEVNMTPRQIILHNGYPEVEHWVTTADGFILNLQQIPGDKSGKSVQPRPVFFLQHGLLGASTNFLTNTRDRCLAFLLADAGFDVWLGNVRGNTYSTNHTHLDPKDPEFWAWSWDEMVQYDLPTMIGYVLNQTGQSQLYYAGHSQGTLIAFTGFSTNPWLASRIKAFFALAPVVKLGHIKGLDEFLSWFTPEIHDLFKILGVRDFLPTTEVIKILAQYFCDIQKFGEKVCSNCLFILGGFDKANINESRLPIYLSHNPAGTSVQNMVHFAQGARGDSYQKYDYGSREENMKHYGQAVPPLYNLTTLRVPTYTYSGSADFLADPTDVSWLIEQLSPLGVLMQHTKIEGYEHFDFLWAMNVADKVYSDIIRHVL